MTLSEPGTLQVAIQRALPGRRWPAAAARPRGRTAAGRGTRYATVARLTWPAAAGHVARDDPRARPQRRLLPRGRYRLLVVVTDGGQPP